MDNISKVDNVVIKDVISGKYPYINYDYISANY